MKYFLSSIISVFLLFSCVSTKDFTYLQDVNNQIINTNNLAYELKFKHDDLLVISINSEEPEALAAFKPITSTNNVAGPISQVQSTYLIDKDGNIDFPVIGKIKLLGLTRTQATELIQKKLNFYVKDPIINLRLLNFKISISGEVTKPGVYPVNTERITLLEALSEAGDLSIYGKRNNILIIREENGEKITKRIDLTNSDFINSPYYYLAQNDVIYVEQNATKRNSAAVGPQVSLFVSIASLSLAVISLFR